MRVAVLGASGFIGSALCARLKDDGHAIMPVTRANAGNATRAFEADVPDTVVNCMGATHKVDQMVESNLICTGEWLHRIHTRLPSTRLIHLGSSSETGPLEGARREGSPCNPSNLYEATKLAATHLCLGYAAQYDMDVCVARPFTVYGSGDAPRKLLPVLWRAWTEGRPFTCHPGGHDWVHIDDFVEGVVTLLHAPRAATKGQVYHLGTGICTSNADIVSLFARALGGSGPTIIHSQTKLHPYDVTDWRADPTKARQMLGWSPKVTIEEGIRRFVNERWFAAENGAPGL